MNAAKTSRPASCPDALPILSAGSHRDPLDGACLMEYVSVLAGERFGDHPRCVHPALAALARAVNDRIRDNEMRSRLALLVPDMIAVDERDQRVGPQLVVTCLMAVGAVRPLPRWAGRRLMQASRRVRYVANAGGRWDKLWRRCRWAIAPPERPTRRALHFFEDYAFDRLDNGRDGRLYDLLCSAVSDCGQLEGTSSPERGERPVVR